MKKIKIIGLNLLLALIITPLATATSWDEQIKDDNFRFQYAIHDAIHASPYEVAKNLTEIAPWNPYTIWNNEGKILVVSYMEVYPMAAYHINKNALDTIQATADNNAFMQKIDGVDFKLNAEIVNQIKQSVQQAYNNNFPDLNISFRGNNLNWVTAVPEIHQFIQKWAQENNPSDEQEIAKRLNEKLGLWPKQHKSKKVVVEYWIDPTNLMRPSLDAHTFDSSAAPDINMEIPFNNISKQLRFDPLAEEFLTPDQKTKYLNNDEWIQKADSINKSRYRHWFEHNKANAYAGEWAVPWNRMGYTYDYSLESFKSKDLNRHFGASEFVIKPESTTNIKAIYSLDEYRKIDYFSKVNANINQILEKAKSILETPLPLDAIKYETIHKAITKKIAAANEIRQIILRDNKKRKDSPFSIDDFKDVIATFREEIASFKLSKEALPMQQKIKHQRELMKEYHQTGVFVK